MNKKITVAVIGCGNMGSALVRALPKNDLDIVCYDLTIEKSMKLASTMRGRVGHKISDLLGSDWFLIGCKPQQFEDLALQLSEISKDKLIISIMAGKKISDITRFLKTDRVVRLMPSIPVLVGKGVVTACFSPSITEYEKKSIEGLFGSGPYFHSFDDESKIDLTTAFTGSGPAYIFEIARIMSDRLTSLGEDKAVANKLVNETIAGSAELLLNSELTAKELRQNVTSKGGTTEAALNVFKEDGLEDIFIKAIDAAKGRTLTL